jgi:hypothetical protein
LTGIVDVDLAVDVDSFVDLEVDDCLRTRRVVNLGTLVKPSDDRVYVYVAVTDNVEITAARSSHRCTIQSPLDDKLKAGSISPSECPRLH